VEGKYKDSQERVYWVDAASGGNRTLGDGLRRERGGYAIQSGRERCFQGVLGTQVELYAEARPEAKVEQLSGWPGTYARVATAKASSRIAFVYSSLQRRMRSILADSAERLKDARPITTFNKSFTARELPQESPTDGSRATAHPWKAC